MQNLILQQDVVKYLVCADVMFYMRLDTIITIISVNNQEACGTLQELNWLIEGVEISRQAGSLSCDMYRCRHLTVGTQRK